MNQIMRIDRRDFLKGLLGASGGLLLAVRTLPAQASAGGPWQPSVYLSIAEDGIVRIVAHRSEMGTGIRTCLPAIVADELGADWAQVQIVQATGDAKYGSQNTDGSRSVRNFYDAMREAGATARTMLEQAAAQQWGVDSTAVTTLEHGVHHASSGKKAGFGELVAAAAALPVPSVEELRYRSPETYRYIGKNMPIVDRENITTGRAEYGMDVQLDGMKYAAVLHCPVLGGKVVSYDATEALKVPGVEQVVQMPEAEAPFAFHALGGLAIIASNTWAAFQGKAKLQVEWDYGPHADYDSETYRAELLQSVNTPGEVVLARGDVDAALAAAPTRHAADYYVPHLAHAPMEPPVALAHVTAEGCQAWAPTQNPQAAQDELATALGLDKEQVVVHVTLLGGGFGRKSKPDFIAEAALLSQKLQAPVKVVWSREDDIQHDYFHAVAACRVEAGLDAEGKAQAWLMRSAFPSIVSTFNPAADGPSAMELGLGFTDLPFAIDNVRGEKGKAAPHVRIGWLRSVANIYHAFAISSFADELADLAGADPLDYLLDLIGPARKIDPADSGADYGNYGAPLERYPIDTGRLREVLQRAAKNAGWGQSLPRGSGLGIACHRSFLTYVANVVEVEISREGTITIPRVHVVADCGLLINPDRVRAQFEGSAVFGASLALMGEISAKEGRVLQSNFHDYRVCRMHEAPKEIQVELVKSGAPPAGAGEPGVPPLAPALSNAIFAATGQRVRSLPLAAHDLSWS
ncbi:MAG TPA: xanthine dehydrogenase family protein molybdopterin-binding subunit [Candidatus Latescibacteria bacterium]|nr:xanthine dehydrogenase family protein molybdopterin-binding subunit [Candidatus Handelsmanbacteria bacterium]HIL08302.1 xanthine dehydrogenase family protein molybdopterin-binding subunit [Candidatus Latescibacterota bacterium]